MASKIFTGKGDDGTTGLLGAGRVLKSDERIEVLGCLDEANAALGLARSLTANEQVKATILRVQKELYLFSADVAAVDDKKGHFQKLSMVNVEWLGSQAETFSSKVTMPKEFIVPGDTPASGGLSLARSIVRRAERAIVRLNTTGTLHNSGVLLAYLNRLSSLCFVLEIFEVLHRPLSSITLAKEE